MKIAALLSLVIALAGSGAVYSSHPGPDTLLARESYDEALAFYRNLMDAGDNSYRTLYNAGAAAALAGEPGYGALYFYRARRISDADASLEKNILAVQSATGAQRYMAEPHSLVRILLFFYYGFSRSSLLLILVAAGALLLVWFIIIHAFPAISRFTGRLVMLVLISVVCVSAVSFAVKQAEVHDSRRAVVVAPSAALYSEQSNPESLLFAIPAATMVRVVEEDYSLVKVELSTGFSGWIDSGVLEFVVRDYYEKD